MKITAIEFTESEIEIIYNYLINAFNEEDKKQVIDVNLSEIYSIYQFNEVDRFLMSLNETEKYTELCNDQYFKVSDSELFSIESVFELYTECTEPDETGYSKISYRSVVQFRITVFYDGEEITTNLINSGIEDKIRNYYSI